MTTQLSNSSASPVRAEVRESTLVARIKRVYASPVPVRTDAPASNDRQYRAVSGAAEAIDAWARRAAAASGFGEAVVDGAPTGQLGSYELALRAREAAHAGLGEILAAMAQALVSQLRAAMASWRRARDARATRLALEQLDDRTLRDIGFYRCEAPSVAAELAGGSPVTRIRTLMTLRDLSI